MMPNDYTVKIIPPIVETNAPSASGVFEKQHQVTFTVGPHGPFTKLFPPDAPAATINAALQQFAANIRLLGS